MKIRPYVERDRVGVTTLWRRVFPDTPPWNHPESDIRRKLAVQRELFYVATVDSRIVGTAMAGFDGHRGWVYYVAVDPQSRRRGIGSALMAQVERGLRQVGCSKLNLQVRMSNKKTVAFYRSLGYVVEERISMAKHLTSGAGAP